jgi:hypothetical protein
MKPKWDSRSARIKQENRRKSKLMIDWRTRTKGTPKQVGQKFPIEAGAKLPLPKMPYQGRVWGISKLAKEEAKKMKASGFTAVIRFRGGAVETIPIIADSYDDFLWKLGKRLKGIDPKQIQEISIAGGGKFFDTLKSAFHKAGTAAKGFVSGLIKGEQKVPEGTPKAPLSYQLGAALKKAPGQIEESAMKASEKLGQISAIPKRMEEHYQKGYGYRPEAEEKPASPVKEWGERAGKPFLKYANIEETVKPQTQVKPALDEEARRQVRRKLLIYGERLPYAMAPAQRKELLAVREKVMELKRLRKQVEIYERTRAGAPYSIVERIAQLEEEIQKAGGKYSRYWIQKLKLKREALRREIARRFGQRGFTDTGKIKLALLKRLAREKGKVGYRARLALKLRSFSGGKIHEKSIRTGYEKREKYHGVIVEPHRFTTDSSGAIRIPSFESRARWGIAASRKRRE